MTGKTVTGTSNQILLSDLIRSAPFSGLSSQASRESASRSSDLLGMDTSFERGHDGDEDGNYDSDAIEIPEGQGWQKMTCNRCMIIWAEPPDPVKTSMICPKCGDVIGREGEF